MFDVVLVDYDEDLFDIRAATLGDMRDRLAAVDARLRVDQRRTEAAVLGMATGADLVMIQSVRPLLNARTIPQLSACRGIIRLGLGYDSVDVAAATEACIPVSNVVDWCTDEVAEHAIALIFACARRLAPLTQDLAGGVWERERAVPIPRIRGKSLGVVGFGRIGRAVVERARALGMLPLVYDPYVDETVIAGCGARKAALDDLLRQADFVTVHTPLTPETRHLLDARALEQMKGGAYVVNTSRGAVIEESALVAALESGKLAGAGLDVMEQEPLPADSPLRAIENVVLTPHVASYSVDAVDQLYRSGADIAARLLCREWVPSIVNPDVRAAVEAKWGGYSSPS